MIRHRLTRIDIDSQIDTVGETSVSRKARPNPAKANPQAVGACLHLARATTAAIRHTNRTGVWPNRVFKITWIRAGSAIMVLRSLEIVRRKSKP